MEIIKDLSKIQWNKTSVTIGKFDGVHIGHRRLLKAVLEGKNRGCTPVVFTFDRFPGKASGKLLYSEEEKQKKMRELGMEYYVLFPFSKENASMEPEQFVKDILVDRLHMKELYIGEDFRFGKDRKGNIELLQKLSGLYGFSCHVFKKETFKDEPVSSSRIREELTQGATETVAAMLAEPFSVCGEVIHGRQLGRTIGIPTINIAFPEDKVQPAAGVYCSEVCLDGKIYYGLTNIGTKPTVQNEPVFGVETYLLQYSGDLYGKHVTVRFLHFLRPEQKFSNLDALMTQLEQDKKQAGEYFNLSL